MAKDTKQRKAAARAAVDARRLTPGKVARLVLKTLTFALLVSLLITLLGALGVTGLQNRWLLQLALAVPIYIVAYPFLMSEFRPKNSPRYGGSSKSSKRSGR